MAPEQKMSDSRTMAIQGIFKMHRSGNGGNRGKLEGDSIPYLEDPANPEGTRIQPVTSAQLPSPPGQL